MTWLLAKIWISVGGAALLGLLIGWAWRGLGLKGKAHRAQAERDLAIADRDLLRTEVDALHAARREETRVPAPANGGMLPDPKQMKSEIELRDQRLKALTEELSRSKEELQTLKTKPRSEPAQQAAPVAAAAASMTTGAALGVVAGGASASGGRPGRDLETELSNIQKQRDDLAWRNRYLESRVALLEQNVTKPVDPDAPPAAPIPEGGEKAEMIAQLDNLKSENEALKKKLADAVAGAEDNRPGAAAQDTEKDQELARLRWRNRYLESRLDYLEGSKAAEPELASETPQTPPAPEQPAEAAPAEPEPVEAKPEPEPEAPANPPQSIRTSPGPMAMAVTDDIPEAVAPDAAPAEPEETQAEPVEAKPEGVIEEAPETVIEEVPPEAEAEPSPPPEAEAALEAPVEIEAPAEPAEPAPEEIEAAPAEPDVSTPEPSAEDSPAEPAPEAVAEPAPEVVAEPPPEAEPAAGPADGPVLLSTPRDGQADSLQAVEGIGPLIEQVLNGLGIYHIDQIAGWTEADAEWVNQQLGFPGRVQRENWIGKAKALIAG